MSISSANSQGIVTSIQSWGGSYSSSYRVGTKAVAWLAGAAMFLVPVLGHAESETSPNEKGTIVAAGFGYQNGSNSTITVKVYDSRLGVILSDDVYELSVKEEHRAGATRGERIFAGGVGAGATDLSNFMVRVYDAQTGVFQWQGVLNLSPEDGQRGNKLVSTVVPRQATVTKVHAVEMGPIQPMFLLSAVDPVTGALVWHDEFFAFDTRTPRVPTLAGPGRQDGHSSDSPHIVDFRIRMYDLSGKDVVWEDQLSRQESDEGPTEALSDQATMLPVWPRAPQEESTPESI